MCGLAGILSMPGRAPVDAAALAAMSARIAHRGPDGADSWISGDGRIGLAHRRLAIIDLDDRARQPMADASGRLRVVYNGEIYNHRPLRAELERRGAEFRTDHSDTEVILQGYLVWGLEGLLRRLEGMYAFAIYDDRDKRLVLARDPIGIKPLYFTRTGAGLAFASEIKALLTLPSVSRRLDRAAFHHYLSFMAAPAPATLFDGIAKLPAGHYLTVAPDGAATAHRFWGPGQAIARTAENTATRAPVAEVRRLVEASVAKHMIADVPVGVFLSGGVDSTTLLALMGRHAGGQQVRSYTVGFTDDETFNELADARASAERHGSLHSEILIGAGEAEDVLRDIVYHQDEPLADWVCIPLWFISKLTSERGTRAVLVGEGADELFFGYPSYRRFLDLDERLAAASRFVPTAAGRPMAAAARWLPRDRVGLRGLADHVQRGLAGRDVFWTGAIAYWELQKDIVLRARPDAQTAAWDAFGLRSPAIDATNSGAVIESIGRELSAAGRPVERHTRMLNAELALRLPELLLMRIDKMTMAHGLESRVPFLDLPLVEYVLSLDRNAVLPGGRLKGLLKDALHGLVPRDVLERPKRGFAAPVSRWLRGGLGERLQASVLASRLCDEAELDRPAIERLFVQHRAGRRDLALHLWPIINAALWYDRWIEGQP